MLYPLSYEGGDGALRGAEISAHGLLPRWQVSGPAVNLPWRGSVALLDDGWSARLVG